MKSIGALIGAFTLLSWGMAASALASDTLLNPGLLLSHSYRSQGNSYGIELSMMHFTEGVLSSRQPVGIGGFVQAQGTTRGAGRFAGGLQLGNVVGAELGYALQTAHDDAALRHSVHLGLFLSAVYPVLALRFDIPFSHNPDGSAQPVDIALVLGLKFPLDYPAMKPMVVSGLPM